MTRHPFWWQTLQTLLQMKWFKNLIWNEEFYRFRISICEVVVRKWLEKFIEKLKINRDSLWAVEKLPTLSTSGSIVNRKLAFYVFTGFLFSKSSWRNKLLRSILQSFQKIEMKICEDELSLSPMISSYISTILNFASRNRLHSKWPVCCHFQLFELKQNSRWHLMNFRFGILIH